MKPTQQAIEAAARAMMAYSRPGVDPDELTPEPRGMAGYIPKWRLYEGLSEAALSADLGDMVLLNREWLSEFVKLIGDDDVRRVLLDIANKQGEEE